MRLNRRAIAALSAVSLIGSSITLPSAAHAKPDQITIYTGPLNTSYYIIGGWLATLLQKDGVKANSENGGAVANIIRVSSNVKSIGMTSAVLTPVAKAGEKPFAKPISNTCAIQTFAHAAFQLLVRKDSGVKAAADLKGKKFSYQAPGTISNFTFVHYLQVHGMKLTDVQGAVGGQVFGSDGVKDRRFVGFVAMSSYPSAPYADAARSVPSMLLPIDDATFAKLQKLNPGYDRAIVPAGTYQGQDKPVPSFGTVSYIFMNTGSSEADQYYVTKMLHTHWKDFYATHAATRYVTLKTAAKIPGTPLCPGAAKYWKEVGAL